MGTRRYLLRPHHGPFHGRMTCQRGGSPKSSGRILGVGTGLDKPAGWKAERRRRVWGPPLGGGGVWGPPSGGGGVWGPLCRKPEPLVSTLMPATRRSRKSRQPPGGSSGGRKWTPWMPR